jgi:hypothetical protein
MKQLELSVRRKLLRPPVLAGRMAIDPLLSGYRIVYSASRRGPS